MSVAPQDLLRGAWFALEQCGYLLSDAIALFDRRSHPSAVALALLAREELGRYCILLELWRRTAAGKAVSVDEVRGACEDHVTKQRRAQMSIVYRAEGPGGLAEIIGRRIRARPGTPEFQQADQQLKQCDQLKLKRTPEYRHSTRMRAMYVDISDDGTGWNRPTAMMEGEARDCLVDAVNDYAVQVNKLNELATLRALDPSLALALEGWRDKPPLPAPTWPDL